MQFRPFSPTLFAGLLAPTTTPGFAQTVATPPGVDTVADEATAPSSAITLAGSAALASGYRFRGVSQSDEDVAVQASLTATHESVAHVDTGITAREVAYRQPSFSNGQDGTGPIADGTFVFSLSTAF